jgi:hypothetical protein
MSDEQNLKNSRALDHPRPGDYWNEMFCPYFLVVDVKGKDITVLSCLGGPDSFTRKNELNAKIDIDGEHWGFDYSKTMVVDREWMTKAVKYDKIDGFVADVINSENTKSIVDEWRDWKQKELRRKIEEAEKAWLGFTGWNNLKNGIEVSG